MSADPFVRDPLPGTTLDGLTISEAIRLQGEARTYSDDDDLRLDLEHRRPDKPRRLGAPSRSAIITLWSVGLIAALGIASYTQVMLQRNAAAAMDASPPPPAALTKPIPPDPILSVPAPIAAGATDATPGAPAATAAADASEPPLAKAADVEPPKAEAQTKTLIEAKAVDDTPSKAEAQTKPVIKAKAADDDAPVKAKAEAKPAKMAQAAAHKPAPAKKTPDDIVRLKSQLNHAYAQAVKAGTPRAVLKARQQEWAVLYERAQRKSPAAVAALYRTRTAQLEALAKRQHAGGRRTG